VVGALCWVVVLFFVFGSRFFYVFCGACGVREILGFLRMWRFQLGLFVERCLICYIFGCRRIARVVCCSLTFYLCFPLLCLGALLYTSCVLGLRPSAFFIEFLLINIYIYIYIYIFFLIKKKILF